MSWINSLELRLGRFAISGLLHYIAALSTIAFVLYKLHPDADLFGWMALDPALVKSGQVWRLVTYLFVPSIYSLLPFPDWWNAVFYVLFLIWMGNGLEHAWGAFRLNLYCLLCVAGITVAAFEFGTVFSHFMFVQALFFAFARIYPDQQITLYFVLPVKVKWVAWFDAAWLLYGFTFTRSSGYRASVIAALACYLVFFGRDIIEEARLRRQVTLRRMKFDRDIREANADVLHRCVVCGRTEENGPDLEFRVARDGNEYCSEHLPKTNPTLSA